MASITRSTSRRDQDAQVGIQELRPAIKTPSPLKRIPSAMTASGANEHVVHLIATTRTIQVIWWLVVVVQLLNGCYLLFFSYIYLSYEWDADSLLAYLATCFLSAPQQTFLHTFSVWVGAVFAVLGSCFAWSTATMVINSMWNRQASFGSRARRTATVAGPHSRMTKAKPGHWIESIVSPLHRLYSVCATLISGTGLNNLRRSVLRGWVACGVRGHYFDQAMLVREIIELFYQAVQADRVSQCISHRFINHAYTTLIAANALAHPVISCIYARNPPMKRFAVVFSDFFLDFVWGCVLPTWMLWPYAQLDRSVPAEQLLLASGFGSIENAQREVEQLVILSWSAWLLNVLPFTSALLSLRSVKKLLAGAKQIQSWSETTEVERTTSLAVRSAIIETSATSGNDDLHAQTKPTRSRTHRLVPVRTSRLISWGHVLLSLSGMVVALIGVASSGIFLVASDDPFRVWDHACKYPLTPWFSTKPACAAWFLNCTEMGIRGDSSDMEAAFSLMDADSLVFLALVSCPQLEVDVALLRFRNLRALMLKQSQLLSWGTDTTLSSQHFPQLQAIVFENSRLTDDYGKIRGFMKGPWSQTIEKAIFVNSDISPLRMSENATAWVNLLGWYCVQCGVRKFPPVLFRSSLLRELALEGTEVSFISSARDLPAGTALWPHLEQLKLRNNSALESLSDGVWGLFARGSLRDLQISGSNVSMIPLQFLPALPRVPAIFAADTPLCRNRIGSATIPSLVC